MAHQPHTLSNKLALDALDRYTDPGDPYSNLATDGNFRAALLKGLDGNMIVAGAILEEVQRQNGNNGHRGVREKAKAYALPVIGGGGVSTLLTIEAIKFLRLFV